MCRLRSNQPIAIFMEDHLGKSIGKMGYGLLRFSENPIVCVIDSCHAGKSVSDVVDSPRDCPVVSTVSEAAALGAEVFVLGIAPSGGLLPGPWFAVVDEAVARGMSVVNGLHDRLSERYPDLGLEQWVWDIRCEPKGLGVGTARARLLDNKRVVMVGTDMANGKMTAGLLLHRLALERGVTSEFLATGQIGISICGGGLPLDAVRVDYAAGAVEKFVLERGDADLVVVEGQGSILHPGSTATLPLLRGTCPTHLILCHRAGQETLRRMDFLRMPHLAQVVRLYEDVARACGLLTPAKVVAISLN
ncbi:MAG: DUF1611 domain-containing protein, partial [Lentisphaeria bacterium]|nr:DUF1611 domain-containing protein [Lentisphaeria bacterium]